MRAYFAFELRANYARIFDERVMTDSEMSFSFLVLGNFFISASRCCARARVRARALQTTFTGLRARVYFAPLVPSLCSFTLRARSVVTPQ